MIICPECEKEFHRKDKKHITCSPECKETRRVRLLKDRDREKREKRKQVEKAVDISNSIKLNDLRKNIKPGEVVKVMYGRTKKRLRKCIVLKCYPYHVMVRFKNYKMCYAYDEVVR